EWLPLSENGSPNLYGAMYVGTLVGKYGGIVS
ncbi:MAG: hypothetical protein ACI8WP_000484, partial [Flavobacteriaceae bacterium]